MLRLTVQKARREGIGVTASALAFVTILSVVPLLAALLLVGARTYSQYQPKVLDLLAGLLPYSEAALQDMLQEFLLQAQKVQGFGVIFFLFAALAAFSTIEQVINRAWGVPRNRPFRQRLQSFTLLLFWGSLLLGGAFSVAVALGRQANLDAWLKSTGLPGLLTPTILLVGLSMLYWLVPFTRVEFRPALLGGAVATLFLELLRRGFASYVAAFSGIKLIYGSFAFVVLFMVSIQVAWTIILAGNQLTYVAQHFHALAHKHRTGGALRGQWLGLAAALLLAERLEEGHPITAGETLASRLSVQPRVLRDALEPLLTAGLVQTACTEGEAFLLGHSPRQLTIRGLLQCYDPRDADLCLDSLPPQLREIRQRISEARIQTLAETNLGDLTRALPDHPESTLEEGVKSGSREA